MIPVDPFQEQFVCCGVRMELMPHYNIWGIGCRTCDTIYTLLDTLIEMGGN